MVSLVRCFFRLVCGFVHFTLWDSWLIIPSYLLAYSVSEMCIILPNVIYFFQLDVGSKLKQHFLLLLSDSSISCFLCVVHGKKI